MPVILKKNYDRPIDSIDNEVHLRLQKGETHSFVYVAPTKRKIRDLQREFLNLTPNKAAPAFYLYTLETLATDIHSILCSPKRFISGTIQAVLMDEAIHASASTLKYFRFHGSSNKLPKGTLQRIINAINTLKEKGIYRSTLLSELESAENFEKPKLQDILTIYQTYDNLLTDQFVDAAGLFKNINERWDEEQSPSSLKSHFGNIDTIFIAGFDEFSDPELTMLYNLSNINNIAMLVSFDYHLENDEVFGHLKENYNKFRQMGFEKITTTSSKRKTFAQHITEHLFKYEQANFKIPSRESVMILTTDNRQTEVELIAKIIKRLVNEKPERDLSKICVSMYQPQLYTNYFREVFERYGIPANITDRFYLDQSPLVISIISLLGIVQHNYRIHDIMRVLSSPYLEIATNNESVDAGKIYEVASLLKIYVGKSTWFKRIDRRLEQINAELINVDDDIQEAQLHHEKEILLHTRISIQRLSDLLQPFENRMTPQEFRTQVLILIEKTHVVECILKGKSTFNDDEKLEKDTRAYQKFLHFLDEFLEVLAFEGKVQVNETLSFYVDRLREAISQVRYNIRQRYGYGVVVTSFDETRGINFDVMIIAGLVDGEFPPIYQPEAFFSTVRRAQKERYHIHEHRYLFYQALTNFTEHLYLTYPKSDGETSLVPSSFIDAITRIVDVDDCREKLPTVFTDTIYSKDELLQSLGRAMEYSIEYPNDLQSIASPTLKEELNEVLDHIRHARNIELSRIEGHPIPEYDGNIAEKLDPKVQIVLQRFREKVYSVTQLESYAACPFQFFANKVLRLNAVKEVEEGITPIERGGILHEILFDFYINRRNQNLPPLSEVDDQQFQNALDELIQLANRKLNELNISDIFWNVEKETILGSPNRKGVLQEFLELEHQNNLEVQPKYFEAAFGSRIGSRKQTDPSITIENPITIGNVRLRGKVDRIDVGDQTFRIVDYKTGTNIAGRYEIELGLSLQLPIYLYAVEQLLAQRLRKNYKGVAGTYYLLRSPVQEKLGLGSAEHRGEAFETTKKSNQLLENDEELADLIQKAIKYVNEYVDNISRGKFPVDPKMPEKVCQNCDFRTICRIQTKNSLSQNSNKSS